MTSIADAYVELHVDGDNIEGEVRTSIRESTPGAEKESDRSGLRVGARWASAFVRGLKPEFKTGLTSVQSGVAEMVSGLAGLKIPAIIAAIPLATSGISALGGAATALVGSLAQASGAVFSFVGVLGSLVQAKIVSGIAFKGFTKAISGDADALAALSPAARSAAQAVTGLTGVWGNVTRAVQQEVFKGLDDTITRIGRVTLPVLRQGLTGTGTVLNSVFKDLGRFVTSEGFAKKFGVALKNNNGILKTLGQAAVPLLKGILSIFIALQPSAQRLAKVIRSVAKGFAEWANAEGRAEGIDSFMLRAFKSATKLWRIFKNLGGTLRTVFSAATPSGEGMLKTLVRLSAQLRRFTELASSKSAIAEWAQQGVEITGKLFTGLGKGFGLIKGLFDPAIFAGFLSIFESIMPSISSVVSVLQDALAPVLKSIGEAFAENGPKFAALFAALSPLLKGVGAVIGQIISQALDLLGTIASVITPVVAVISNVLGPILVRFAPIIAAIILLFGGFAGQLVRLVPIVGKFIAPLVSLASWISGKFVPVLGFLGKHVGLVFRVIGRVIGVAMKGYATVVRVYWGVISKVFQVVLKALQKIVPPVFNGIKAVITKVWTGIRVATTLVWNGIKAYISGVIAVIKGVFKGISAVVNFFRNAFERVRTAVSDKLQAVILLAKGLPDRFIKGLQNIGSLLLDSGKKLIQGFIKGILSKLGAVKDAAGEVAGAVKDFFPFSPVKEGPLKAWNNGAPGKVLMDMLAMGIYKNTKVVTKQAESAAGGIVQGLVTGLAKGNLGEIFASMLDKVKNMLENETITKQVAANMTKAIKKVGNGLKSLVKEYEAATTKLQDLRASHLDMMQSIASSLTGELSLGDAKTPEIEAAEAVLDDAGNVVTPAVEGREAKFTFGSVAGYVKTLAARIGIFAGKLKALIAAGIPKELVAEVAALGSETGSKVADALLSGTSAEVGQLVTDWNALQANAVQAGTVMADAYFATGIAAQEGLIRGLLDDERLDAAAEALAKKMTKKLKKALGIKSPSVLLAKKIGHPSGRGVGVGMIQGLDSMQRAVNAHVSNLIQRPTPGGGLVPPRAQSPGAAPRAGSTSSATTPPAASVPNDVTVNQNFYGPSTSGGRLREMEWTLRYATSARGERQVAT